MFLSGFFEKLKNRQVIAYIVVGTMFLALLAQLLDLTVRQGSALADKSVQKMQRTIVLIGERGKILDRNGLPLAYDLRSYDVTFYRDPTRVGEKNRALYTDVIMKVIDIVERNGGKFSQSFSIKKGIDGVFLFDWGDISADAAERREKLWRRDMRCESDWVTPEQIYIGLRARYQIPDDMPYEKAVELLSVWQDVQLNSYKAYSPITIATGVSMNTVAEIETRGMELDGISIAESATRIYPKDETAAHIVGYMGKMYTKETDDETIKKMKEKGYSQNDFVGVSGIEATMEEELSGAIGTRQGKRVVEVNQKGKIMRELETSLPTPGNNVVLSIDLPLQKVLETALKNNIQEIRNRQEEAMAKTPSVYAKKVADRGGTPIQMATQGAAIVMDVNTGEILALASYPSFDPNIFTGGISTEDYKALTEDKSYPLFNKAVSSRAAPGSAFKMVTGLAGLMEGKMTVSETINDESPFTTGMITGLARAPKCWIWPHCEEHQNENIEKALKDSCNYYFFTVAYELGINLLDKWADKFGFTSKTGIELPGEVKGIIGSQKMLYDNTKPVSEQATSIPTLVRRLLIRTLKEYFKEYWKTTAEEAACDVAADELLKLAGTEEEHGPNIRRIINEQLHIPQTTTGYKRWDQKIDSILYELQWNSTRTVLTGVGQGITLVTPIEMVRYVAALVNGGNVLEPHLVKRVVDHEGRPVSEKMTEVVSTLDAPSGYIEKIQAGMHEVVNPEDQGTASKYFVGYKYTDMIGAKTGSAQVSKIDIENTSWFVAFAPFDRPEIAMVVYIPNGYSGGLSSLTAKDVIEYYLDNKLKIANDDTPTVGKLTE